MGSTRQKIKDKIKLKVHHIYGIFDFEQNKLISVNVDLEPIEMEFDVGNHSEKVQLVEFDVILI